MGRGRAKAKQTKVARELKYRSVNTDFASLEAELRAGQSDIPPAYADLAQRYEDDGFDDEDDESTSVPSPNVRQWSDAA
ncbi:MAG: DUF3073 domain-containing protein [Propionibacteriaceae bacterium]|jgi:hypothetical protein|nr:DUF3073 domain-containing protein [Propionibacteriaceae bacterium]